MFEAFCPFSGIIAPLDPFCFDIPVHQCTLSDKLGGGGGGQIYHLLEFMHMPHLPTNKQIMFVINWWIWLSVNSAIFLSLCQKSGLNLPFRFLSNPSAIGVPFYYTREKELISFCGLSGWERGERSIILLASCPTGCHLAGKSQTIAQGFEWVHICYIRAVFRCADVILLQGRFPVIILNSSLLLAR